MNQYNNKYSEYLEVFDFPSEINPSSVMDKNFRWQDTFPHRTFVELLKAVDRMLGRATSSDKKDIWIEGAYGTGKSRIAWTLKTLLECSPEEFAAYFNEYDELRKETDLRDRLLGHKRGKIVTVYRYSTSEIDNIKDFILAIYESTSKALKAAGVPFHGENTLRGGILAWLSKPANQSYLTNLLKQPEYRNLGSIACKTAEEIVDRLKHSSDPRQTIQDLQTLGKEAGITAFSRDMENLKSWLTEVITENDLKAIVFVWDEFSEFFRKNRNELGTFQSLIELASDQPFYLMIVTHDSIFSENDKEGKKVRDRFVQKEIKLPDSIAFDLIRHVIKVKPTRRDEWLSCLNGAGYQGLKDLTPKSSDKVSEIVWKDAQAGKETLAGMLPLHPMAALLLKYIAEHFASNQRSMFNFIKNDDPDLKAFRWFINNKSPEDDNLLTINYLWDFFYEKGTDDYGSAMGRSSLDTQIRTILDTYPLNQEGLFDDEKAVLKTILMMQAISEKLGYAIDLFLPTEDNLDLAFEGTDNWNYGQAQGIAKRLVERKILFTKPAGKGNKTIFAAAAMAGDQQQIDRTKEEKLKTSTDALIQAGNLDSALKLLLAQKDRFTITPATSLNFTAKINKISNEPVSYRIPAVMVFARTDEERTSVRAAIRAAVKEERYKNIVFIDVASSQLSAEKFEEWANKSAQEEYWRPKDRNLAENSKHQAEQILEEWRKGISDGTFMVSSFENPQGIQCQSIGAVRQALARVVLERYPLSLDEVNVTEVMWTECFNAPKRYIEQGIQGITGGQVPSYMKNRLKDNESVLNKLQKKINTLIEERLSKDGRVAIGDVFEMLMQNGFMPCNFYAYLTGYLLSDYVDSRYRFSDGETSNRLTVEKLAEITAENIKHCLAPIKRYREKYIEILTPEQTAFVHFAKNVWNVEDNQAIEGVTTQVRNKLKTLYFPIWCLKELNVPECEVFLDLLAQFANSDNGSNTTSENASKLGQMLRQKPDLEAKLKQLLTPENAKKGMLEFLKHFEGGIVLELAKKIGVPDVLSDVKQRFTSESLWLWNQEVGVEEIQKLLMNYQIVDLSIPLLGQKVNSFAMCIEVWREKIRSLKIPYAALITERPELKVMLGFLKEIAQGGLSYENQPKFLEQLKEHAMDFNDLYGKRVSIFRQVYDFHLNSFVEDETTKLYTDLPADFFLKEKGEAETIVAQKAEKILQEQEAFQLRQLWKTLSGTDSPKDWSTQNRTPIIVLVPEKLREKAKRTFETLNRKNPDPIEIQEALQFLKSNPSFLSNLNNRDQIDDAFRKCIVKKYAVLLQDLDEVRDVLHSKTTVDFYDWYGSETVNQTVAKLAQARYNQTGCAIIQERISSYEEPQIKKLLDWLIQNSVDAGIKILTEYEA